MFVFSDTSEAQLQSAKYMHRSLILRAGLALGSFVIGSQASYQQELSLFLVFTIINGVLGGLVFFFHCTSNEKVRNTFKKPPPHPHVNKQLYM